MATTAPKWTLATKMDKSPSKQTGQSQADHHQIVLPYESPVGAHLFKQCCTRCIKAHQNPLVVWKPHWGPSLEIDLRGAHLLSVQPGPVIWESGWGPLHEGPSETHRMKTQLGPAIWGPDWRPTYEGLARAGHLRAHKTLWRDSKLHHPSPLL